MIKVEFGIVHEGCLVNELSRALPEVRFICPGGFVLGPSRVEEVIIIDQADETAIEAVLAELRQMSGISEAELLEYVGDKAFIRLLATVTPHTGFCSKAIERNRCFPIGMEIQHRGIEHWKVGCARTSDAEQLIEDLKPLGEIKYHSVSEVSWRVLLESHEAESTAAQGATT